MFVMTLGNVCSTTPESPRQNLHNRFPARLTTCPLGFIRRLAGQDHFDRRLLR